MSQTPCPFNNQWVSVRASARPASPTRVELESDPEVLSRFLEDAAHYPGGRAGGLCRPRTIDEISGCLRTGWPILPIGGQSSLTGGATPFGEIVLSTERLTGISQSGDRIRVGAGVPLQTMQDALAGDGRWFPPAPTFLGAFAGGVVATCAAGAATFKYGTVRNWVEGLTVVLAGGDVLELHRGEAIASSDGRLEIDTSSGLRSIQLPQIQIPDVPKCSAGYYVAPHMDLVDLFIGSEGTLAVIAEVTFRTATLPAAVCLALVPLLDEPRAIRLVDDLRAAARHTWQSKDPNGIDVSAIEHIDARSISLIREDAIDRKLGIDLPDGTGVVLLVGIELSAPAAAADLWRALENVREPDAADSPLRRLCLLLDRHGVLDSSEIALPHDRRRATAFAELREAVPAGVNRRVAQARQHIDPMISKTAADMIVPFAGFGRMMESCRRLFAERDLDLAVWGHISDGNVHPNVIPRSLDDVTRGKAAILELGREVIAMGGCPLAEHGVGRNPVKQQLLRTLYGPAGVDAMRQIKLSLDLEGVLAPGVIFPPQ